jgi:hypothetical protein
MVAVTGHRDLVPAEIPRIRALVVELLTDLREHYPDRGVAVMSLLAEGADRLVAEAALGLGIPLTVLLPMPADTYARDFVEPGSRERFDALCTRAVDVFTLPIVAGATPQALCDSEAARAQQYAQAGVFLCAHCHILLAVWDGKPSDQVGGTSQVVRFHHDDVMPGYTPPGAASRLILTDDESDLVYHIVCSRDRPDGEPAPGLRPCQGWWYTTDDRQPRVKELPPRHARVFKRLSEFNNDVRYNGDQIANESWPLYTREQADAMPPGLKDINQVYRAADWLAIHYQKRRLWVLRLTHICVLLMGVAYVSYTDYSSKRWLIFALLGLMMTAMAVSAVATRGAWHRRYLDYRALAEGLRIQFYWAAAGVTSGNVTKFAHDNFLQMQDPELGWIRNVMRVAGIESDASAHQDPAGLEFAVAEWIGDYDSGQLGYYRRKSTERQHRHRTTQGFGRIGLWASAVALGLLLFVGAGVPEAVRVPLTYLLGLLLLAIGVRQSFAKATAEAELIKQYDFMHRIFLNAHRRIDDAANDAERRRILKILGDAALEEHAQWILMHRERSIDQKEIVKLG